ncbi:signal peptidase II [Euzebya tangerina]|uniref:signal peptidase II n=1 Tax=Euzebya tangerina TaxID=591198 RepID=UPI0013C3120D|nr:signal peptidase II [Euzebya tangerina]
MVSVPRDAPSRSLIYATTIVVSIVWVVLDQATKLLAVRAYSDGAPDDLGPVVLRLVYNTGAAFSLPIRLPWLFVTVTVLVVTLVARALPDTPSVRLAGAYGLVVGGAIGNALDRIFRDGAVVDMIDLDFPPLESFPVFNVADIGITVGAGLVLLFMVLLERREAAMPDPAVLAEGEEALAESDGEAERAAEDSESSSTPLLPSDQ